MSKLVINTYPENKSVLTALTQKIDIEKLSEYKEFIEKMITFVEENEEAIGLAANQVWHLEDTPAPSIFVMGKTDTDKVHVFINPTVYFSGKTIKHIESCLSRPGKAFNIKRSKNCTIHYFDIDGEEHIEKYGGAYAQVIGHEMQHLAGEILTNEVKKRRW